MSNKKIDDTIDIIDLSKKNYKEYSLDVIEDRALPIVTDGLKPVLRRILYTMDNLNLNYNSKHVKSARIVGDCLIAGTKISTNFGLKNIEDIEIGNIVYTQNGFNKVTNTFVRQPQKLLKIYLENTVLSIVGTFDHKIKILNDKTQLEFKSLKDLTINDYIVLQPSFIDLKDDYSNEFSYDLGHRNSKSKIDSLNILNKLSNSNLLSFLSGLIDKQGSIQLQSLSQEMFQQENKMKIIIPFYSKTFLKELSLLLFDRFGILSEISKLSDIFVLSLNEDATTFLSNKLFLKDEKKLEKLSFISRYRFVSTIDDMKKKKFFIKIKQIKELEEKKETYDFEVENEHEFIANGIVSHNCIGKTHPHGDCLHPDTKIFLSDGTIKTIKEIYDEKLDYVDIFAYDEKYHKIVKTKAHSFRIGQYSKSNYIIDLGNKHPQFECTENHQFYIENKGWTQAKDININDKLFMIKSFDMTLNEYTFKTYKIKNIYKKEYEIEIPMYDFTVDNYENMLFTSDIELFLNKKSKKKPTQQYRMFYPIHNSSVYEAMVRVSQDFQLRYPLIDGQGNWGSRDGDSAAAYRYTEARLTKYSELLLTNLHNGAVDFKPNFDGSFQEPITLPARLPFLLLNGAIGIAVAFSTNIPSHNLTEIGNSLIYILENKIKNKEYKLDDIMEIITGPDFPTGGKIISSPNEIKEIYKTGAGSIKIRGTFEYEEMDKKNYKIIINSLPYGVSVTKILEELNNISAPTPDKKGKISEKENLLKITLSNLIDNVYDDYDKTNKQLRIVIEPKNKNINKEDIINFLCVNTSFEINYSISFTLLNKNKSPKTYSIINILSEFCDFRIETQKNVLTTKLEKINNRINILNGRIIVYLNVDEVIKIIRNNDNPKEMLMTKFKLNEEQVEDILELKLRQIANLEKIKIEQELEKILKEKDSIETLLNDEKKLMLDLIKELKQDIKIYGDDRKTEIKFEEAAQVVLKEIKKVQENLTVVISKNGYIRSKKGHELDIDKLEFKLGDGLDKIIYTQTGNILIILSDEGKLFNLSVDNLPNINSEGKHLSTFFNFGNQHIEKTLIIDPTKQDKFIIGEQNGYGFISKTEDLITKMSAGKNFFNKSSSCIEFSQINENDTHILVITENNKKMVYNLNEINVLPKGKGILLAAFDKTSLKNIITFNIDDTNRINDIKTSYNIEDINDYIGKRNLRVRT